MYCKTLLFVILCVLDFGRSALCSEPIRQAEQTYYPGPCTLYPRTWAVSARAFGIAGAFCIHSIQIPEKIKTAQSAADVLANLANCNPSLETKLGPLCDDTKRRSAVKTPSFDPTLFPIAVSDRCLAGTTAALEYVQETLKPILLSAILSFPQTPDEEIVLLQRMNLLLRNENFNRLLDGGGVLMDHPEEMESIFFMLMALPFFAVHTTDQAVLGWGVLTYLEGLAAFNRWLNWSTLQAKVASYYCDETLLQALARAYAQFPAFDPGLRNRLAGISLVFLSPWPAVASHSVIDVVSEHKSLLAAASLAAIHDFNAMDEHEQQNILWGSSLLLLAERGGTSLKSSSFETANAGRDQVIDYALTLLEQIRIMNFVPKGNLNFWYCHPKLVLGSAAIEAFIDHVTPERNTRLARVLALDHGQQALWQKHGVLMASLNSLEGERSLGNRRWRPEETRLLSDFMEINSNPDSGITMMGQSRSIKAVVGLTRDIMIRILDGDRVPTAVALSAGIVVMPTGAGWFRFGNFGHEFSHLFEKYFTAKQLSLITESYRRIQGRGYYTAYFETNVHEALAELMGNWFEDSRAVLEAARACNDPDFWRLVHAAAYASLDASGRSRARLWKISLADSNGYIRYEIHSHWEPVVLGADGEIADIGERGLSPVERVPNSTASMFSLFQNYPNPFNPLTRIEYELARPAALRLSIYNALGLEIRTLVDARRAAGRYAAVWDGTNNAGRSCAAGVYWYRLQAGDVVQSQKMILLR